MAILTTYPKGSRRLESPFAAPEYRQDNYDPSHYYLVDGLMLMYSESDRATWLIRGVGNAEDEDVGTLAPWVILTASHPVDAQKVPATVRQMLQSTLAIVYAEKDEKEEPESKAQNMGMDR